MSNVVIAISIVTLQINRREQEPAANRRGVKGKKSAVGACIQTMTVGVIELKSEPMACLLLACDLKCMVGTAGSRSRIKNLGKSCVGASIKGQRSETALAPCL